MNLNNFLARKQSDAIFVAPPQWFVIDPKINRFVLHVPKDDKKKINFDIESYIGCLPIFVTKVAGITYEGRGNIVRKANGMINKGASAQAQIRLMKDKDNEHHRNAIKVLLVVKSYTGNLMKESCIGYVPARLADFIRYCEEHAIKYKCNSVKISASKKWASVNLWLSPNVIGEKVIADRTPNEEEPIRIPMVRKAITGPTIEDFRNALLIRKKGNI